MEKTQNGTKPPRCLTEERDACGVGFIAYQDGRESNQIVQNALKALICLEHRGACCADRDSGDGSGILTGLPIKLFQSWFVTDNIPMPEKEAWGVGMVFLPQDEGEAKDARAFIEEVVAVEKLKVLGWRQVPVRSHVLGVQAREHLPRIEQVIVTSADRLKGDALERVLYVARSRVAKKLAQGVYICSFSCRTIVYKGMVRGEVLESFYEDLQNEDYCSAFAIYHRRFSTNTMPQWPFAQPMRLLGHNGEINTLLGNINWMMAREVNLEVPGWSQEELAGLTPIVNTSNSDSYNLDSAMELLVRTGRSTLEAAMILVPEAYNNQPDLKPYPEIVDFYQYYEGMQEAWDGPALLVFSDGKTVGAQLDRNGLRPARYSITKDGCIIVASETGVVDLPEIDIIEKGRLGPGMAIAVDLQSHEILKNWEIKQRVAKAKPYGEWLHKYRLKVERLPFQGFPRPEGTPLYPPYQGGILGRSGGRGDLPLLQLQTAFGYRAEDVEMIIQPMATVGKEPTFCMGDDIPLAVLSSEPRLLYDYFKQRFAQVTNPPIDPLRESLVMSLQVRLGSRGNVLNPQPEDAGLLELASPLINEAELAAIKNSTFQVAQLSTLTPLGGDPTDAIQQLCQKAGAAVESGKEILILSDRETINEENTYIPPLLAVGAVHHYLIRQGLRLKASLIIDTAQCWSTHHFACLIGYGASAVSPYLALETVRQWWGEDKTQRLMENGKLKRFSLAEALERYRQAVEAGLLKILSKMGISLLSSYQGAQIFEAIGLGADVVNLAFAGTTSRVGGLSLRELAQETMTFHSRAFPMAGKKLENLGLINYKPGGEYHMNSPEMAKALHKAVGDNNYDHYEMYHKYLQERPATALRDLLDLNPDRSPIPLAEVEPVEEIVRRFCTGGMSLGALSREAHETLAVAMNRLGGKSNSGEGGEDQVRFKVLEDVDNFGMSPTLPHLKGLRNGDTASSAIKQVASGRFGVTPEYLMSAQQLEIKVAQGAKPGEGGQLPGKKVSAYIAGLRRSKPGVTLISPPPHHDIYSIEDLSQLIFDLHQINPQAKVSVKLVAEIGIGTIAAGVTKANADIIQVSGHDGGTGASPLSSIKHAGVPWELGVTEVHRILLENQLRDRVILRADGGLKTGWDVVMAALMGAEEFGFGSIAMIAEGCIMARICHTNNCPVGVATQQERLRKRFTGRVEQVTNFFYFIAEEIRSLLARLGYSRLSEIIGRGDLLKERSNVALKKTCGISLASLTNLPNVKEERSWLHHETVHSNGSVLDDELLGDLDIAWAIKSHGAVKKEVKIVNTDRCVGGRIAGKIASLYGNDGFEGTLNLHFHGAAGQSFGAFNLPGMKLVLRGEANDYVGKGMNGGEIVILPPQVQGVRPYNAAQNAIMGNTCLYGATGGVLYGNGRAGERFAVRNSKGTAVIEGAGDHCCEYMTGGVIVVLGSVGRNVGAGMTGGLAYFLDEDGSFPAHVNKEIVQIQRVSNPSGEKQLKDLIAAHLERTGSQKALEILAAWETYLGKFWQVVPPSEADTPEAMYKRYDIEGMTHSG